MGQYKPDLWDGQVRRVPLLESFEGLTQGDLHEFQQRPVDSGVGLEKFRAALASPRALQRAMHELFRQRPLCNFTTVLHQTPNNYALSELFQCPNVGEGLELSTEVPGSPNELIGVAGRLEEVRRAQESSQDQDRAHVIIAVLALRDDAETMQLYMDHMIATHGSSSWKGYDPARQLIKGAFIWEKKDVRCRARLRRFGIVEVDDLNPVTLARALPEGAQPANLPEVFAAIDRFPGLLSWMRLDPDGGRRELNVGFWMLGMRVPGEGRIRRHCRIWSDPFFDAPQVDPPYGREPADHERATSLVPYVIPILDIQPQELL